MNAAHRQTDADSHALSASEPFTPRTNREPPYPSMFQVLSDRQAVIAVMAANGRTNHQISLRLKIPVQAVKRYLDEGMSILRLTSQHDLTYSVITAHFSKTSPASKAHTNRQNDTPGTDTPPLQATTPDPASQTLELNPTPAPASTAGPVSIPQGRSMPLSGVGDQLTDSQSIDELILDTPSLNSPVIMDVGEAADATTEAVQALGQKPYHDHSNDNDPDEGAALKRDLVAAVELLKREHSIVENLQNALHTRDMIGQAKGILMARYKISADAAFALLQDESSRTNQKIIDIAAHLTHTD